MDNSTPLLPPLEYPTTRGTSAPAHRRVDTPILKRRLFVETKPDTRTLEVIEEKMQAIVMGARKTQSDPLSTRSLLNQPVKLDNGTFLIYNPSPEPQSADTGSSLAVMPPTPKLTRQITDGEPPALDIDAPKSAHAKP